MKRREGYLLLESIASLSITVILLLMLFTLLFQCINMKYNIEDKIELQQQAAEITTHIEDTIGNSMGIISINSIKGENYIENTGSIDAVSIKCKYKNIDERSLTEFKEIDLKKNISKIFINTLNDKSIKSGEYEIGDYIDKMHIEISKDGRCADIKLQLSKNKQSYESRFKVYIRNFDGEKI